MSNKFNQEIVPLTNELVDMLLKESIEFNDSSPFVPSREKVIEIIKDLRRILFPKNFSDHNLYNCTLRYYLGDLLLSVEQKLTKQIELALMRKEIMKIPKDELKGFYVSSEITEKAEIITSKFLQQLPKIKELLKYDILAFYDGDPAAQTIDEVVLCYPGMFAIMTYRLAHELYKYEIPIIPRLMTEYAHSRTGVDINPGAEIGKYFFIDHATGVVIGETTKIADHVKLYQGVTLGALSTEGGQKLSGVKRHPTIEENVTIYANATVLGGDTVIGHDSVIGGSCFITKSIPPYTQIRTKLQEITTSDTEDGIEYYI